MESQVDSLKNYIKLDLTQEDLEHLEQYFLSPAKISDEGVNDERVNKSIVTIIKFLSDHIQGQMHLDVDGLSLDDLFNLGDYLKANKQQAPNITPAMNSLRAELMLALEKDKVSEEQIPALRKYASTLARVSVHVLKEREYSEEQKLYINSEWWFILLSILLIAIPMSSTPATFISVVGLSGTVIASAEFMAGGLVCGVLFGFYQLRKEQNKVRRDIALGNAKYRLKKEANDRQLRNILQELINHLNDVAGGQPTIVEEIAAIQEVACKDSLDKALDKLIIILNQKEIASKENLKNIVSDVKGSMQGYKRESKTLAPIFWLKFWTYPWMTSQDWIKMVVLGAISLYCVFYKYDSILSSLGVVTFLAGTALVPALPYIFAAINIALTLALIGTLIYSGYKKYRQTELRNNLDNQIRIEDNIYEKNKLLKEKIRYLELGYKNKKMELKLIELKEQAPIADHNLSLTRKPLVKLFRRKKIRRATKIKRKRIARKPSVKSTLKKQIVSKEIQAVPAANEQIVSKEIQAVPAASEQIVSKEIQAVPAASEQIVAAGFGSISFFPTPESDTIDFASSKTQKTDDSDQTLDSKRKSH